MESPWILRGELKKRSHKIFSGLIWLRAFGQNSSPIKGRPHFGCLHEDLHSLSAGKATIGFLSKAA
jgi:hypothetical protein